MIKIGSIVEILNLSEEQISDIASQRCLGLIEHRRMIVNDIIGQRYKVLNYYEFGNVYTLENWNHGGHDIHFKEGQLLVILENGN